MTSGSWETRCDKGETKETIIRAWTLINNIRAESVQSFAVPLRSELNLIPATGAVYDFNFPGTLITRGSLGIIQLCGVGGVTVSNWGVLASVRGCKNIPNWTYFNNVITLYDAVTRFAPNIIICSHINLDFHNCHNDFSSSIPRMKPFFVSSVPATQ